KRAQEEQATFSRRFEVLDQLSSSLALRLASHGGGPLPDEFFEAIVEQARQACDAEYAALGLGDDPTQPFERWIFAGVSKATAKSIGRSPRPVGLLGEVIRTGRSVRLKDLRQHSTFRGFPAHHPVMKSFLG